MEKLNNKERAAQAWCDLKTSDRIMDVELCLVFARMLDEAEKRGRDQISELTGPVYRKLKQELKELKFGKKRK